MEPSAGKHTVNPATSGYNKLMIVACDSDAEDGYQDADELDRGFCVPGHCDCGLNCGSEKKLSLAI